MTPQEYQLVEDLFERLAMLERNPREPDAEDAIHNGLRRAPNAVYALVQTVLLQDEALRQANDRIQELEASEPPQQQGGGFLDSMRDAMFGGGGGNGPRASVPQTGGGRPMGVPSGFQRPGEPYQQQGGHEPQQAAPTPTRGGGSFLGTAAAAAAGVIGGSVLMNSLKGAFGGDQAQAHGLGKLDGQSTEAAAKPWGDTAAGGGDLARQAGLDNVGQPGGDTERAGLFDQAHEPVDHGYMPDDGGDFDTDFDSDYI